MTEEIMWECKRRRQNFFKTGLLLVFCHSSSRMLDTYKVLFSLYIGGHHGHYAEVAFKWGYPALEQPKLAVLHQGRLIYCGQMSEKKQSTAKYCAANESSGDETD